MFTVKTYLKSDLTVQSEILFQKICFQTTYRIWFGSSLQKYGLDFVFLGVQTSSKHFFLTKP